MDISEVNFKKYLELKKLVNEIKTFVYDNHEQLFDELGDIAPIFKIKKDEYNIILNRVYHLDDEQLFFIKHAWKKNKKEGLLKAVEFAYIWQLKGGKEFLKRIRKKLKRWAVTNVQKQSQ